jgi:hypothetical protein
MPPDDYKEYPDFDDFDMPNHEVYEDDRVPSRAILDVDDIEHDADTYNQHFGASLCVPIGDEIRAGKVNGHKRELDGTVLGSANINPMLDTRTYEI